MARHERAPIYRSESNGDGGCRTRIQEMNSKIIYKLRLFGVDDGTNKNNQKLISPISYYFFPNP